MLRPRASLGSVAGTVTVVELRLGLTLSRNSTTVPPAAAESATARAGGSGQPSLKLLRLHNLLQAPYKFKPKQGNLRGSESLVHSIREVNFIIYHDSKS